MKNTFIALAAAATMSAGAAFAATDTIDAASGQAGTYFVPTLGQETDSPYYRWYGEGWSWTHNALAPFTTATLNISAYDVDEAPCGSSVCENDTIEAYDATSSMWILLGSLTGDDNAFSFTSFDLVAAAGGALLDDVLAGLQVRMKIDVDNGGWAVSLSKSVITTDGSGAGNPNPGTVPLPAGGLLLIGALGGLGALRRKRAA